MDEETQRTIDLHSAHVNALLRAADARRSADDAWRVVDAIRKLCAEADSRIELSGYVSTRDVWAAIADA